jgi:hypothetical protein
MLTKQLWFLAVLFAVVGVGFLFLMKSRGQGAIDGGVFQPKLLDGMKEVGASEKSKLLDAEATSFFRGQFAIQSARYYEVPGEISWSAVSKSVQNQMAEQSMQRVMFTWYEPGIDFIEVYPQGSDGSAFAVAMPKGTNLNESKLIGFYVLSTPVNK